ncbi:hypothetical protein C0989_000898 [Termitomyces sp. Mn162]|nr:hypothetical protein C0989_000898 [Termitomyces sp. Mn162]
MYFLLIAHAYGDSSSNTARVCRVHASADGVSDDAPAIRKAFEDCQRDGHIIFDDTTFHIESVLQTTGLHNVVIDLRSTLLVRKPLAYPTRHTDLVSEELTLPIGEPMGFRWAMYDFANGVGNLAGRPINLMITNTTDSHFNNLRFVQSQFWTMAIKNAEDVLLDSIYINSTSSTTASTINTDGVDTFYANRITFRNWTVTCGDDNISTKANLTNILIQDSVFHAGRGIAIGSIGQYPGVYERVENVTAERVTCFGSTYAAYVKTWTSFIALILPSQSQGGGGGLGYARNITFRDFDVFNLTDSVAFISQCTSYSGATGGCDTSLFQISDVTWGPMVGNVASPTLASLQCSGSAPCPGIRFVDFDAIGTIGHSRQITCENIVNPIGFNCTS